LDKCNKQNDITSSLLLLLLLLLLVIIMQRFVQFNVTVDRLTS
jgi:hypothetical protein